MILSIVQQNQVFFLMTKNLGIRNERRASMLQENMQRIGLQIECKSRTGVPDCGVAISLSLTYFSARQVKSFESEA